MTVNKKFPSGEDIWAHTSRWKFLQAETRKEQIMPRELKWLTP